MRAICWNGAATTSNQSSTLQALQRTYHVFLSYSLARLACSFLRHQTTRLRFFGGICSRNQRADSGWSKREDGPREKAEFDANKLRFGQDSTNVVMMFTRTQTFGCLSPTHLRDTDACIQGHVQKTLTMAEREAA